MCKHPYVCTLKTRKRKKRDETVTSLKLVQFNCNSVKYLEIKVKQIKNPQQIQATKIGYESRF